MDPRGAAPRRDDQRGGEPQDAPDKAPEESEEPAMLLPQRRIPGDLGWRLDQKAAATADPVGLLRVVSVIPFVMLGAVAVIALVGWLLLFVLGFGAQESLWSWASGEPGGEALRQIGLVLLLGLASLGTLALAMWATLYGFRLDAGRRFWGLWQALVVVALGGLVVVEVLPRARHVVGLHVTDVVFLGASLIAALVLFRLREVRVQSA